MRLVPFSTELHGVTTSEDCHRLMEEITALLKRLLDVDKRIFKKVEDKSIYKSRLELYSNLYKETRVVFIRLIKGKKAYYKEPLTLEDFLDKFYYSKTVIYEEDDDEEETLLEEIFEVVKEDILNEREKQNISKQTYTTEKNLIAELLKELETIMNNEKKILRRDDPEVMKAAVSKSLAEFVNKYSEYTDKNTLEKVFHELRLKATSKTTLKETVTELTGKTPVDEPITPIEPKEVKVTKEVLPVASKPAVKKEEGQVAGSPLGESFKKLPKEDKDLIVQDILSRHPEAKTPFIKAELIAQGWVDMDYDSIYYSLERCKKNPK